MKIKIPTKLMLSGEWSILEVNNPCIVLAINKYVSAKIKPQQEKITIKAEDINLESIEAKFNPKTNKLIFAKKLNRTELEKISFLKESIELTLGYLKYKKITLQNFKIETSSKNTLLKLEDGTTQKIGLGSSAAITVASISAILKLHEQNIKLKRTKNLIFKLAASAHFLAQGKMGSGFDIAASTFGGATVYKRFDHSWLSKKLESKKITWNIFEKRWPKLSIKKINLPDKFHLCVCWSGKPASTKNLILKINRFKKEKEELYFDIINKIKKITSKLIEILENYQPTLQEKIVELIRENEKELMELGEKSKVGLETKNLVKAIKIANNYGGGGKISGAGSGDCAIAVCFKQDTATKIKNEWKEKGLQPIRVKISP